MDLLQYLNYGAAGFCACLSILCWRIISAEQKRSQNPRKAILQTCYVFMGFCLVLSILTTFTELRKNSSELETLKTKVKAMEAVDEKLNAKAVECATAEAQVQSLSQMIASLKDTMDYMKGLIAQATNLGGDKPVRAMAVARPVTAASGGSPTPVLTSAPKPAPTPTREELNAALDKMLAEVAKVKAKQTEAAKKK